MRFQLPVIKSFLLAISMIVGTVVNAQELNTSTSTLFSGAGNCAWCHKSDASTLITNTGEDISPSEAWRSSMMANAARDPFWQAKVSAEVAEHPALQSVIEDKCTTCHMPMGRTEALHKGSDHYSIGEGMADHLAMDGVSCTLCHQIQSSNMGKSESFSGQYLISDVHQIYGPYSAPLTRPMERQSGYTPMQSNHASQSELCATCHTLFTPYLNDDGDIAGEFPEQTPYLEWENSRYPGEGTQCQTCHMPASNDPVKISVNPGNLTTLREPVWRHDFVGGNTFMAELIKNNLNAIDPSAEATHLNQTITKMRSNLTQKSLEINASGRLKDEELYVDVTLKNLTGHKLPSGFPSRRVWINMQVYDADNQLVFESGKSDENGNIVNQSDMEQHYDSINSREQTQIYESVMEDVNGDITYTLLRSAAYKKDNRIPPQGFTASYEDIEMVAIAGNAENDADFNKDDSGQQGSGADVVHYKISLDESSASYRVIVQVFYQSISPFFASELFTYETSEVGKFKSMYDKEDKQAELMGIKALTISAGTDLKQAVSKGMLIMHYPNPASDILQLEYDVPLSGLINIVLYDALGNKITDIIRRNEAKGLHKTQVDTKDLNDGIYYLRYNWNALPLSTKKVVFN